MDNTSSLAPRCRLGEEESIPLFPTQCMDSSNHRSIPEVLDDAENELPDLYRPTLNLLYGRLITIKDDIDVLNEQISTLVKQCIACDRLPRLEGVGPISSVLLYATRC